MNRIISLIAAFAIIVCAKGGTQPSVPAQKALPIIQQIEKALVFIYVKDAFGLQPHGTGFFVGLPDKKDKGQEYVYLVTAKHVLTHSDDTPSSASGNFYDSVFVRLNRLDGGADMVEVTPNQQGVFTDLSDPTVDVAAIPMAPDHVKYDYLYIQEDMFATNKTIEDWNIGPGDNVFFGGLFVPFVGVKRNYPIMRFGKVAMLPNEKVPLGNNEFGERYLVEAQSWGGNSGAPVFFSLQRSRDPNSFRVGDPQVFLAGIMEGYFPNYMPVVVVNSGGKPAVNENTGIALIVPAHCLLELLHGFLPTLARGE